MRKRKEEKESKEIKPNNLNGCNYVLPPDKLLAKSATPPTVNPTHSLGNRSFQQRALLAVVPPLSLRATSSPDRGHGDLDNVRLCVCEVQRALLREKMQMCACAWKS